MPEVQEVFHMATQKVRPDPGFVDRQHDHRRRKERNRKIGAFAVAAAIAVTAAVAIVTSQPRSGTAPADGSSPVTPVNLTAIRSARNFSNALGAFDTDTALAYLAPDADISGLLVGPTEGADGLAGQLRLNLRLLEAQGLGQIPGPCELQGSSASATTVRCWFDFHLLGSDQLGLGPFTGSSYGYTVQDGLITQASVSWEIDEFSPQVWEPFASWVYATYPGDAEVMYAEPRTLARVSEASARLWEQHVQGYVTAQTPEIVQVAQRFMEARNTYDADAIMTFLPEGGAVIRPMQDNLSVPNILTGRTRMDRGRLALAFEAERILEVEYRSVECRSEPSVHYDGRPIVCTYVLDSRLRQIAGIDPAPKVMRIGVRDGQVTQLSFPWLGVSFPGNVPAEGWAFFEWLQGAHPDAGAPGHTGTLFRYPGGQDMELILTPDSLDLLEQYLDEYERAVG
jgi:hypothetical protein